MLDFLPHKVVLQVTLEPECGQTLAASWSLLCPQRKKAAGVAWQALLLRAATMSKPVFKATPPPLSYPCCLPWMGQCPLVSSGTKENGFRVRDTDTNYFIQTEGVLHKVMNVKKKKKKLGMQQIAVPFLLAFVPRDSPFQWGRVSGKQLEWACVYCGSCSVHVSY